LVNGFWYPFRSVPARFTPCPGSRTHLCLWQQWVVGGSSGAHRHPTSPSSRLHLASTGSKSVPGLIRNWSARRAINFGRISKRCNRPSRPSRSLRG